MEKYCVMNIGIDIDGVLTNDDDYILDFTSKYCYEHGLKGFDNANLYEYRKLNWYNDWGLANYN